MHILSGKSGINGQDEFKAVADPWNAYRDVDYNMSFGRITIFNATHLQFQQHLAVDGGILDSVLVVQENHGPFATIPCAKRSA